MSEFDKFSGFKQEADMQARFRQEEQLAFQIPKENEKIKQQMGELRKETQTRQAGFDQLSRLLDDIEALLVQGQVKQARALLQEAQDILVYRL